MKLSLHGTATSPDLRFRRYLLFSHRKSLKSPLPTSEIPKLLALLIISLLSCSFILAPHLFFNSVSTFSLLYSFGDPFADMGANTPLCSSVSNAMTHFLFMKPGTDWAAETYYGEPARKLGLKYISYEIVPKESSLYEKYSKNDIFLREPETVNKKGWEFTKNICLDSQYVRLDLRRFRKWLVRAYDFSVAKMNR